MFPDNIKRITIKNRKNKKLAVLVEECKKQNGIVFVMHGLGGFKEQPHIDSFANAFRKAGYTVIRFDTTYTLGESYGKYENATTTNYHNDLEDIIKWSKSQSWYQEPFCLIGHSLGGICVALYAQKYSSIVKALAPISTVVSGKLTLQTEDVEKWKKTGWKITESTSKPGTIKKLPWSHMEDRLKYDLLIQACNHTSMQSYNHINIMIKYLND